MTMEKSLMANIRRVDSDDDSLFGSDDEQEEEQRQEQQAEPREEDRGEDREEQRKIQKQQEDVEAAALRVKKLSKELLEAVRRSKNITKAKQLIADGADVTYKDEFYFGGRSVLHHACYSDASKEMIQLLLQHGADLEAQDKEGQRPLHVATRYAPLEVVQWLVMEAKADTTAITKNGSTILHFSIFREQTLRWLLEIAAAKQFIPHVNATDKDGETALHRACRYGSLEVVQYLVARANADLTMVNREGNNALFHSIQRERIDTVKWLFSMYAERGMDPIALRNPAGNSMLHVAVQVCSIAILHWLVHEQDFDVETRNARDETALLAARLDRDENYYEIVRYLMNEGEANTAATDADGNNCLYHYLTHRLDFTTSDMARLWLEQEGIHANSCNHKGETIVHTSVVNFEIFKMLLNDFDDITVIPVDTEPDSPIGPLAASERETAVRQIRQIGAGGGGIYVRTGLQAAADALAQSSNEVKHVILLADGADAEEKEGAPELIRELVASGATVSTVSIGNGPDVSWLQQMAELGRPSIFCQSYGHSDT